MPRLRVLAFGGMDRRRPPTLLTVAEDGRSATVPKAPAYEIHSCRADLLPLLVPRPVPRFPFEPGSADTTFPYRQESNILP